MAELIVDHNREKLLNLITYFVKKTKYCGKTKLFKLLYYADFRHFKETGKSITGLKYFTWQKGPVPKTLFFEMGKPGQDFSDFFVFTKSEGDALKITPKKKFDGRHFTKREIRIIDNVAFIFQNAKASEMVKCTHLPNDPWSVTFKNRGENKEIDYTLAFDKSPESLGLEEHRRKIEEIEEIRQMLL